MAGLILPTTRQDPHRGSRLLRHRAGRHWHPEDLRPRVWMDPLNVPGRGLHGVTIPKWTSRAGRHVDFDIGTKPYYWSGGNGLAGLDAGGNAKHPALNFEGSHYLQLDPTVTMEALIPNTSGWTCAMVVRQTGGTSYRSPFSARAASPTSGPIFYLNGNTWEFWTGDATTGGWNTRPSSQSNTGNPTILIGGCEWGVAGSMTIRVNSTEDHGTTGGTGTPNRGTATRNARIGAGQNEADPAFFWYGAIGCMLFFDRKLDAGERRALAFWLGRRYGIAVTA